MGMTPSEIDRMSVFQYMAARDGHIEFNDPDGDKKLTDTERDALWEMINR